MKLIPATLEALEALPQGAIVTPLVEHFNDYVFLRRSSEDPYPWSDIGVSDAFSAQQVLTRCTQHQQTQLIQLWPDEDSDILSELLEQREQLAQLTDQIAVLNLSRIEDDGSLLKLRVEHDGLTARVFDNHVGQDATNRGFTARIDAVSERSSREEMRLDNLLTQQQQLIRELQSRLTALEQKT